MKKDLAIGVFIGLFMTLGCGQGEADRGSPGPKDGEIRGEKLIERERFVKVLASINLTKAALDVQRADHSGKMPPLKPHYRKIFEEHGVTRGEFKKSLAWYQRDSDTMAVIFDALIERYRKQEERVGLKKGAAEKEPDRAGNSSN